MDTTQRVITLGSGTTPKSRGSLYNMDATLTIYISTDGSTVVTTDAQAEGIVGIPPETAIPIPGAATEIKHKVASGTAKMYVYIAG